jgi:hypothetical protein
MFRPLGRTVLSLGLLVLAFPASAQEKLTKVEIGKRGKAATAFLAVPRLRTGTAFCVHPSGLFITNEHVIRGAEKEKMILVLHPSLEGQRVLEARVVRIDPALDLALLRVEGAKDLPSLPLGSIKDVAELSDVVACGFSLGVALAPDRKEYPAISVTAGTVTALRYKDRELQHLQIDVAGPFGNFGGPVLDDQGKVIGVVQARVAGVGKGANIALSVNRLEGFLKKPDIVFTPPTLTRAALAKPMEFKASLVSPVPGMPEPSLKLILQADDEEPREFPMKKEGPLWSATVNPTAPPGTSRVEIAVRLGKASISGTTDDAVFKVAGKPMRLSAVRRIEFKEKPTVVSADGRGTVEGEIAGLGTVEIDLAGQKVKIDLTRATQVTVQAAPEVVSVLASVSAIVAGKEVARTTARMIVRDAVTPAPADPSTVKITPPSLPDEEKVVKRLPEVFGDVAVGAAGRYLIFHFPKLKKLGVFDVNEARVTRYIPLAEDDITFAAGLDALVIGYKKANKLERWSLTSFELEKTFLPPGKGGISSVVLGHSSRGPVIVNGQVLDLETFKFLPFVDPKGNDYPSMGPGRIASGDGTVYGGWNTNYSPATSTTFVLEGGVMKRYEGGDLRHVIPGPDGRTVFTGKGIVSQTLQRADAGDANYGYCLPAVRGDYFLALGTAEAGSGGSFTVYFGRLKRPIAHLPKVNHGLRFDGWDRDAFGPWRRVYLIPEAKAIAVLPPSNDQVVLHKFDAEAALDKSEEDYLFVNSRPPREVKAGTTFTYPIKAKSKKGGMTYKVDSGPKEMTVSAEGVVTWAVPAELPASDQDVILTVRDRAGQEVFHSFTLRVVK